MTTDGTIPSDRAPAVGALSNEEWVARHVPRFHQVRPIYEGYGRFLETILKIACQKLAPNAVVESRTKTVASFAEKILRKRRLYESGTDPSPRDPLVRMTDLCGCRVVLPTAADIRALGQFIETTFEIDWPNSEDASQRLQPAEFGYRSVHYIVQVNPEKLQESGMTLTIPPSVGGLLPDAAGIEAAYRPLKAEIQVRTLLEHAAASLGHDTIYKTRIQVPDRIRRQHATLAAMLENVDSGFAQLLTALKEFKSRSGPYLERHAIDEEIANLRLVLAYDPANVPLAVRIAQLALAVGNHDTIETVLRPFARENHFGVQRTLGQSRLESHWDTPRSAEYREAVELLEAACAHAPRDAETLCLLADGVSRDDPSRACALFHEAIQTDSSEPETLSRYLEFEIAHLRTTDPVRLATPLIRRAADRARTQIESRVNLPAAHSSSAIFQLLLGEPFAAFDSVGQLACLCRDTVGHSSSLAVLRTQPNAAGRYLLRLRDTLRRLLPVREELQGFEWIERFVLLAIGLSIQEQEARAQLSGLASWNQGALKPSFTADGPIVLLAGGCSGELSPLIEEFKPHLFKAVSGLDLVVIGGGTVSGVSGLAGELAVRSDGRVRSLGYLPSHVPAGVQIDSVRYTSLISTPGTDFTPMEPLQAWTDLAAAGIRPTSVKLIAYAPGTISRAECALALALGARVGIILNPRVPAERQRLAKNWEGHPGLTYLPMDAMTLRAFLCLNDVPLDANEKRRLERAARKVHEEYVAAATPLDPSFARWEALDEALKLSNFSQVAYWERMLAQEGLGVRNLPAGKVPEILDLTHVLDPEAIQRLAEAEHGRWNVERLTRGWKYAPQKDVAAKLSPYLASWRDLPPELQKRDLDTIGRLPNKLREMGLELFRR